MSAERIARGLAELADLAQRTAVHSDVAAQIADRYVTTLRGGGTLFFAGNGGSAADAQHLAAEYTVRFRDRRRPFRALALTTDTSVLTAAGNDFGFEEIFARQVEALAGPKDLLTLHSTSGESSNLVAAAHAARRVNVPVVAFLGRGGGRLLPLVDLAFVVPSDDVSHVQELHLALGHLIVESVEEALGG